MAPTAVSRRRLAIYIRCDERGGGWASGKRLYTRRRQKRKKPVRRRNREMLSRNTLPGTYIAVIAAAAKCEYDSDWEYEHCSRTFRKREHLTRLCFRPSRHSRGKYTCRKPKKQACGSPSLCSPRIACSRASSGTRVAHSAAFSPGALPAGSPRSPFCLRKHGKAPLTRRVFPPPSV